MSLQTAIHAFCFALTLSMYTVASARKFCSIHAYILIACSFLEASRSNIYHFVSHLCLESICSIWGCRREQMLAVSASLAHVHLPAFNIRQHFKLTHYPFQICIHEENPPQISQQIPGVSPDTQICFVWFMHVSGAIWSVLSDPNNSFGSFGTKLHLNEEKWGYLGYVNM